MRKVLMLRSCSLRLRRSLLVVLAAFCASSQLAGSCRKDVTPAAGTEWVRSEEEPQAESPRKDMRTIAFLGDSLTAGYQLPKGSAFPAVVEQLMRAEGITEWRVHNAGVSGDTSRGALERLDWLLKGKPAIIFVCIGANDGLRGLEITETQENLRRILDRIQESTEKPRILLAGMELPRNYGHNYVEDFRLMYENLARERDLPFLPFLLEGMAMNPELTLPDGIHPNAEGAKIIAERVMNFIRPHLVD